MRLQFAGDGLTRSNLVRQILSCGVLALVVSFGTASAQMPDGEDTGPGGRPAFAGGQMIRGTVTAVAPDKLTLKTETGEIYQVALTANTRVGKGRQPIKPAEIKAGDGIGAMGVLDAPAKTIHAVFVAVIDAEDIKKAREGLGKIYIAGKVTAIDELKLTVLRADGVSQGIEVDEGTSFKRGRRDMAILFNGGMGSGGGRRQGEGAGAPPRARPDDGSGSATESITLADVKVGDTVAGPGALKHGVFVPTELGVMDASAMGQRRRRPGAEGAAPPGAGTPAPANGAQPH